LMETGKVGDDGFARTTSPPYPGFSAGGQYRLARADQPEQLRLFGFGAPPHVGFDIAFTPMNYGIPLGFGLIPLFLTIDISFTFLVYRRNPNEIPAAEQTQTYQLPPPGLVAEVEVDLPTIDPREVKPKIDSVEVTQLGDDAQVKITGERFRGSKVV